MTRRRLIVLTLIAIVIWFCVVPRAIVRNQNGVCGIFLGPADRPLLIIVRQDNFACHGFWMGGYFAPPTRLGCDWAIALEDSGGVWTQYQGRIYELGKSP
jgi:hypothetical protein